MGKIHHNIPKTYLFSFFWMFLIFLPVFIPYLLTHNISMHQVFLLQVVFGLTVVIFEVPSGYLSDLWGRKNILVLGGIFNAIGFSILIYANSITGFVLFEIFVGIAASLASGTDLSMLYDSLKEQKLDRVTSTKTIANLQFFSLTSEGIAAIAGGLLAVSSYSLLLKVQWFAGLVPLFVALTLTEPSFKKISKTSHRDNFSKVFSFLWKDLFIRLTFFNLCSWGVSTFIVVWIFQKYWQEGGIDLYYFGFIWASYNFTVALTSKIAPFLERRWGSKFILALVGILPIIGYLGLSLSSVWVGIGFGFLFQISRGINQVILRDALNWRMPSEFRATANSISSLVFRLGFCIIGPAVGFSIDQFGTRPTLLALAAFFTVLFIFLLLPFLKRLPLSTD